MTIVEQTDLSEVTYLELNELGPECASQNVDSESGNTELDSKDNVIEKSDTSEPVRVDNNDGSNTENVCDNDVSRITQGACAVDSVDTQASVGDLGEIMESKCAIDTEETTDENKGITISNVSQNVLDSTVSNEELKNVQENTENTQENVTTTQDSITDSDIAQDTQSGDISQELQAESPGEEIKNEPLEIAATPTGKPHKTETSKPEVKMTETFKPKVEHPKIYPVIAEETPEPGMIKPFTAEQLKSLYYNAELEHLDDFVDNFLQVKCVTFWGDRGGLDYIQKYQNWQLIVLNVHVLAFRH